MTIIQIVPALPPVINGLGDYAWALGSQLKAADGINSHYVVADSNVARYVPTTDSTIHALECRTGLVLEAILDEIQIETVLLHYVGYGYSKRGFPFWLSDGLKRWKQAASGRALMTIFHELYGSGPVWTSGFWTSPLQQLVMRRIAALSDNCRTSMELYGRILGKTSPTHLGRVSVSPVFSNVGEVVSPLPLAQRRRQMVVFGGAAIRRLVYSAHGKGLAVVLRRLKLERIVDIGPELSECPPIDVPIEFLGPLPAQEVSAILAESYSGFLTYYEGYLAKSGIFAAYCAHGVLPVLANGNGAPSDGIHPGKQFLSHESLGDDADGHQFVANDAFRWYQGHSLARTASEIADQVELMKSRQ